MKPKRARRLKVRLPLPKKTEQVVPDKKRRMLERESIRDQQDT